MKHISSKIKDPDINKRKEFGFNNHESHLFAERNENNNTKDILISTMLQNFDTKFPSDMTL